MLRCSTSTSAINVLPFDKTWAYMAYQNHGILAVSLVRRGPPKEAAFQARLIGVKAHHDMHN